MPPLPPFVLACPASLALILRAQAGELPRNDYYDAWDALADPDAYKPTEEVREWMHEHWAEVVAVPEAKSDPILPTLGQVASEVNPTTPTITPAREAWDETWMPQFFTTFVTSGGNVTKAVKAAGKCRDTFYEHRDNNRLFYAAYLVAREEANDRLRGALDDRAVVGWEEPVFGRVGKDLDGIVGYQWKYDSSALRLLATRLPEFRDLKEGGTTVNVTAQATANAAAQATALVANPEMLGKLQARTREQAKKKLARIAQRRATPPTPSDP